MRILHLSDIHGAVTDKNHLLRRIREATECESPIDFLVVSGDFSNKGKDATEAAGFVRQLQEEIKVPKKRTVVCPGNHDLETGATTNQFAAYRTAVVPLLDVGRRASVAAVTTAALDGADFVTVNSAAHLDHKFGVVDIAKLTDALKGCRPNVPRIVVVHHHIIPQSRQDQSHLQNAFEFISVLVSNDVDLVLHGHRHAAMTLRVGNRTRIVGAGSITSSELGRNTNNQFNVVEFGSQIKRLRWIADIPSSDGRIGTYQRTEEAW